MPDPAAFNVLDFLRPISEEAPSGEDLHWEDEFAEIQTAREEEEDAKSTGDSKVDWRRDRKKADWVAVVSLGSSLLKDRSKDLRIAAYVAEGMFQRRGLAGFRDGIVLLRSLLDTFWETVHPDLSDLELREGIFESLDDERSFPLMIRQVPLTRANGFASYSYLKYKESRKSENDIRGAASDRVSDLIDQIKADGKIRAEDFDHAADATERPFADDLVRLLGDCLQATQELNQSIRRPEHFGSRGPILSKTMVAIEEVSKLAAQLLARKPGPPPPDPVDDPDPEPGPIEESGTEPDEEPDDSGWEAPPPPPPVRRGPSRAKSGGPIAGPDDARARVDEAARYLREADPADPAPYLLVRALRMAEIYRSPNPLESSRLLPPPTEARQAIRRLAAEGAWAEALEQVESLLGRPEGAGWLDARRIAIAAMAGLGHLEAERAAAAVLLAELHDYPEWPDSELDDGNPCANAETRAWIKERFPAEAAPRAEIPVEPTPSGFADEHPALEGAPRDPWDEVQDLLRENRPQEAIALIGRAARDARTGRERFLRTLQQAEVCLALGRPGVATPLLERLARQIDELRLDQWEDTGLCARVVASLYRCLRGKDEARALLAYERLCQLDIGLAMSLNDGIDA